MTDRVTLIRAAVNRAREARKAADPCPVAACRGSIRTSHRPTDDGDAEPYGYCSTCGLPVS